MNKLTLEERIEKLEKNNVQYEAFINLAKYLMDDKSKIIATTEDYDYVWNVDNPLVLSLILFFTSLYSKEQNEVWRNELGITNDAITQIQKLNPTPLANDIIKRVHEIYNGIIAERRKINPSYSFKPRRVTDAQWVSIKTAWIDKLLYALLPLFIVVPSRISPDVNNEDLIRWRQSHRWLTQDKTNIFLTQEQEEYLRYTTIHPNAKYDNFNDIDVKFFKNKVQLSMNNTNSLLANNTLDIFVEKNDANINKVRNELGI
tara:strand:+ start:132 stop:908 length:777 start_codon:yes stop_codon:yes gene_type:complete